MKILYCIHCVHYFHLYVLVFAENASIELFFLTFLFLFFTITTAVYIHEGSVCELICVLFDKFQMKFRITPRLYQLLDVLQNFLIKKVTITMAQLVKW